MKYSPIRYRSRKTHSSVSSKKSSSSSKYSNKKSPSRKIKSHYRMRGMGVLLNMYGGAVNELEQDFAKKKEEYKKLKAEFKQEQNKIRKEEMRIVLNKMKESLKKTKEKINQLLSGIAKTTSKAYGVSKEKLSSGIKSSSEHIKGKYKTYKEESSIKKLHAEQARKKSQEEINKIRKQRKLEEAKKTITELSDSSKSSSTPVSTSDLLSTY